MKLYFDYKILMANKQRLLRVAIITMLILAAFFLFLFPNENRSKTTMSTKSDSETKTSIQSDATDDVIVVDVAGEVNRPAVIELAPDSRINDAILAAGGLTKNADISQINRAAILSDGEKIFIPKVQTATDGDPGTANADLGGTATNGGSTTTRININTASSDQLQNIPGIGPVTADKIVQYRRDHGLFRKLKDLTGVSGIGDKTFEKMKQYICI